MSERSIRYVVTIDPPTSRVHVEATFRGSLPEPFVVALPTWTPGSYLIREYAKHVEGFDAVAGGVPVGVRRVAKNRWALAHGGASQVTARYTVYAHDLTVRTCHVDDGHAYLNGAALYVHPLVDPWRDLPCEVALRHPLGGDVATPLRPAGEGTWRADSYDALVDSPMEIGPHETLTFDVAGVPHTLSIWNGALAPRFDRAKLRDALARIVAVHARRYGGLPYARYVFQMAIAPGARGGLEHDDGCSVMVSPEGLDGDDQDEALSLFAHEHLHAWHVRRIRPEGLWRVDYERENHSRLLWLFEGATSYFDWRALRAAGLVDARKYLRHLVQIFARLDDTPGRLRVSLEDASWDAWQKLYRPDENSLNATVSYYLQGEAATCLLDLELRRRSDNRASFDDVMRHLWTEYGQTKRPVPEDGIEAVIAAATGVDVSDLLARWVRAPCALPVTEVLGAAGLEVLRRRARGGALNVRLRQDHGRLVVANVYLDGAASRAGIAPGDEIVAVDGRRVDESSLRARLRLLEPGSRVELLLARFEQITTRAVTLAGYPDEVVDVRVARERTAAQSEILRGWLGLDDLDGV